MTSRRWPAAGAVAALLVTLATTGLEPAAARPDDERARVRQQISRSQDDLEGTSRALTGAYQRLAGARNRLTQARAAAAAADRTAEIARARSAEQQRRLAVARANEAVVRDSLARADRARTAAQDDVAVGVRAMYRYDDLRSLSVALGSADPESVTRGLVGFERLSAIQQQVLQEATVRRVEYVALTARANAVTAQRRAAEATARQVLAQSVAAQQAATAAAAQVAQAVAQQESVTRALVRQRDKERSALAALRAEDRRLTRLMAQLAARARAAAARQRREAAARARREAAARARGHASSSGGSSAGTSQDSLVLLPVSGPVTSPYGWRIHPIYGTRRMHTGTDIGAACGTVVRAAEDGRVVRSGWAGGAGLQLVLDNGAKRGMTVATTYNHLSRVLVGSGTVRRGQPIALVGTTGASTGCHLHWELFLNGSRVNPMSWI